MLLPLGGATAAVVGYRVLAHLQRRRLPERFSGGTPRLTDDRWLEFVSNSLNYPVSTGNAIEPLFRGDDYLPAMIDAIDGARSTLNFMTFVWWEGDVTRRFADALVRAAERGVEVRILVDAFGGKEMEDDVRERLESVGCRFAMFKPLEWDALDRFNFRTHRRALVIDGTTAFTGGAGIAEEWTGDGRSADSWRDTHYRLEGPIVGHIQGSFAECWRVIRREVLSGNEMFPALEPAGEVEILPLLGRPRERFSDPEMIYWFTLQGAREELDISTPYYVPSPSLHRAIVATAERGVRVRMLLPSDHNDSKLARLASQTFYSDLLGAGVELYEYGPSMMHAKMMSADREWTVVGTSNFDYRSIELNYETALAVRDRRFSERLVHEFETDIGCSRRVVPEDLQRHHVWNRLACRGALLFRAQL